MVQNPYCGLKCARVRYVRVKTKEKKKNARLMCSLCLSGWVGMFSEDGGGVWLYFVALRYPAGVELDGNDFFSAATSTYDLAGRSSLFYRLIFYRTQIDQRAKKNHSGGFNYLKSRCLEKKSRGSNPLGVQNSPL